MSDADLDYIFEDRTEHQKEQHRNFTTCVAGNPHERGDRRVMVKCKYHTWTTHAKFPQNMNPNRFKKTTMAKFRRDTPWKVLEDHIRIDDYGYTEA
eukprot:7018236-Karenia_brevis.AAC.1